MLFPTSAVALRCIDFLRAQDPSLRAEDTRMVKLGPKDGHVTGDPGTPIVCAVLYPERCFSMAKTFWQHTGDGVSSRRAEFCHSAYDEGVTELKDGQEKHSNGRSPKGPRRYRRTSCLESNVATTSDGTQAANNTESNVAHGPGEWSQFVEERFGRNLGTCFASNAKLAIKRRIAGSLTSNVDLAEALEPSHQSQTTRQVQGLSEDDIYLYPSGMSSIFNTHRLMLTTRGPMKSICFG